MMAGHRSASNQEAAAPERMQSGGVAKWQGHSNEAQQALLPGNHSWQVQCSFAGHTPPRQPAGMVLQQHALSAQVHSVGQEEGCLAEDSATDAEQFACCRWDLADARAGHAKANCQVQAYSDALAQQEAVIAGLRAELAAERASSEGLQGQCKNLQEASKQLREAAVGVHGQDAQCMCSRLLASNVELARENAQLVKTISQLHGIRDAEASQHRRLLCMQQAQLLAAQAEVARLQAGAACDGSGYQW